MTRQQKKLWGGLLVLALLTPLGIILPERFNAGGAWGEWSAEALSKLLGYLPEGLRRWAGIWKAPIPDYNFGGNAASATVKIISYVFSGFIGILAAALLIYLIGRIITRHEK